MESISLRDAFFRGKDKPLLMQKRQWKWKLTYKAGTHHKNPSFSIPPMCTTQHLHARLYRSCWAAGHANVGGQGSIS
eukprot:1140879-Pelagomonas_calceolata.AAC.2